MKGLGVGVDGCQSGSGNANNVDCSTAEVRQCCVTVDFAPNSFHFLEILR